MNTNSAAMDTDELMHLALQASGQARTEQAIGYLKRLIELQPDHGQAHYLLGALHAEIGMYDRAVTDMQRAIELDIDLPTAHFQLGLLHITSGRVAEAAAAWEALEQLPEDEPLLIFKRGLLKLAEDQFSECADALKRGISLNHTNPALNQDMARILAQVEPLTHSAPATDEEPTDTNAAGGKHVLLSAYKRNDYDKNH